MVLTRLFVVIPLSNVTATVHAQRVTSLPLDAT